MAININEEKNIVELCKLLDGRCEFVEGKNNEPFGIMVSEDEADRERGKNFIKYFTTACNGNINEMMRKLFIIATMEKRGIKPDEVVVIAGTEIILSYSNAKAYTMGCEEIANCDDLPDMPKEAVKAVLMARVETVLG